MSSSLSRGRKLKYVFNEDNVKDYIEPQGGSKVLGKNHKRNRPKGSNKSYVVADWWKDKLIKIKKPNTVGEKTNNADKSENTEYTKP